MRDHLEHGLIVRLLVGHLERSQARPAPRLGDVDVGEVLPRARPESPIGMPERAVLRLETGDMGGPTEKSGMGRPLSESARQLPQLVWIKQGKQGPELCWKWKEKGKVSPAQVSNDGRILESFLGIADSPEVSSVTRFVREFGVLGLCRHGVGPGHKTDGTRCIPTGRELLKDWYEHARRARSLILIASQLHQGHLGRLEDWRVLSSPDDFQRRHRESLRQQRQIVGVIVWNWLRSGNVKPGFHWHDEVPRIELYADTAYGALGRQLSFAIARIEGFAICHGCGAPFIPSRKPRAGQRNWCIPCKRENADKRQANRDYYDRKRAPNLTVP